MPARVLDDTEERPQSWTERYKHFLLCTSLSFITQDLHAHLLELLISQRPQFPLISLKFSFFTTSLFSHLLTCHFTSSNNTNKFHVTPVSHTTEEASSELPKRLVHSRNLWALDTLVTVKSLHKAKMEAGRVWLRYSFLFLFLIIQLSNLPFTIAALVTRGWLTPRRTPIVHL